ncbi:MAG: glycosyltransferase family 1 protein [Saprospirales bacterium]|nr:MAG: glycosyltransferase family 1 protein [Saprospirales bacterium]
MNKATDNGNIRVVHLSSAVEWRGGEQQILYLYQGLKEKGVQQWIWVPSGQVSKKFTDEKVNLKKLFFRQPWFLIDAIMLWFFCKKNKVNLIHAHDSKAHSLAFLLTDLLGLKCPAIVHRRVDNPIKSGFFTRKKFYSKKLKRIICVSSNIKNVVDSHFPELEKKSVVVYSGVSSILSGQTETEALRNQFSLSKDEILVGNISALDDHKDPQTFLEVAIKMIKSGFKAKFVWIGGGESWKQKLLSRVKNEGLEEDIFFPGYIENAKKYLKEFDVFLFTSSTEGLGTTVIDAMMMKVPIVATAGGGVPELISDKQTGILVAVGDVEALSDGILWLSQNPLEREDIVVAAYAKATTFFSIDAMVRGTLDLYFDTLYFTFSKLK